MGKTRITRRALELKLKKKRNMWDDPEQNTEDIEKRGRPGKELKMKDCKEARRDWILYIHQL
jgi:hypothetical protein